MPPRAPDAVITGVAVAREPLVLPPEAIFEATLLDVSRPEAPPVVLGRQSSKPAGHAPFAIRIPYHSARFARGRYEVRVTISLEGRLGWTSNARYLVPQDPAYRSVSVQLQRIPSGPATLEAGVPLERTYWRVLEIDGEPVPRSTGDETLAHLVLQPEEGNAQGYGGCNRFLVDYALQGELLQFGSVVAGIGLCPKTSGSETRYFQALSAVQTYRQQGNQLTLWNAEGATVLRLEAAEILAQPLP